MILLLRLRGQPETPQQLLLDPPSFHARSALSMVLRGRQAWFPLAIRSRQETSRAHFRMGPRGNVSVASPQGQLRQPHIPRGHKPWQAHQAAAWLEMDAMLTATLTTQACNGMSKPLVVISNLCKVLTTNSCSGRIMQDRACRCSRSRTPLASSSTHLILVIG